MKYRTKTKKQSSQNIQHNKYKSKVK